MARIDVWRPRRASDSAGEHAYTHEIAYVDPVHACTQCSEAVRAGHRRTRGSAGAAAIRSKMPVPVDGPIGALLIN